MIPKGKTVPCPTHAGEWKHIPTGEVVDVYPLEPTGGQLCVWGPDVGITYSGAVETQGCWTTDEWQGHIPVNLYDSKGPWQLVRDGRKENE